MQNNIVNSNEPLSDEKLEAVSGGEIGLSAQYYAEVKLTCKCGQSFFLPYQFSGKYQCPFCHAIIMK